MAEAGRVRAVLFDLDGTLVDTAPDLIDTLNTLRRRRGLTDMAAHLLRPQASHGTQGLLRLGLGVGQDHPDFSGLRSEFLDIYQHNLSRRSRLFPEMDRVLEEIEVRGLAWGVVTNKPAFLTEPLLDQLGLAHRAACVVSGDTCARNKPHPDPVLHACQSLDIVPGHCIYVGDAARDVEAARAAGMPALVALYGYLDETDQPEAWGATGFIRSPSGLMDWLVQA